MASEASIWEPRERVELSANSRRVEERFVASAGQAIFNLDTFAYTLGTGSLEVYKNGLFQAKDVDWVEQSDTSFQLIPAASAADRVVAVGFTEIEGTVVINEVDIYVPNYQSVREYIGTLVTVYAQGGVTRADGGEGFFQYVSGQAPGFFVDDNSTTLVPVGGNGSAAWKYRSDSVYSYAQLRALPIIGFKDVFVRNAYLGGMFSFDPFSTKTDDSGTVLKPDSILSINPGRWIRTGFTGIAQASWYGVIVTNFDNSNALDLAEQAFYTNPGLIKEMKLPSGVLGISRNWVIGDGSATNISTIQGIKVKGTGRCGVTGWNAAPINDPIGGTTLKWIGAAAYGPMVTLAGPMSIEFDGINLDGNGLVQHCLHTHHIWHSLVSNMTIVRYTAVGMWMFAYHNAQDPSISVGAYGRLVASGSGSNILQNVYINSFGDALPKSCLSIGSTYTELGATSFNHDVNQTKLDNCAFLANGHGGSRAVIFNFCDAMTILKCFIFAPPNNVPGTGEPYAMGIYTPVVAEEFHRAFPGNFTIINSTISNEIASNDWLGGSSGGAAFQYTGLSSERNVATSVRVPRIYGLNGFSERMAYFGYNRNQIPIENPDIVESLYKDQLYFTKSVLYRNIATPQIANSAAATKLSTFKLKANLFSHMSNQWNALLVYYDRVMKISFGGAFLNNTGVDRTLDLDLILDAGTVLMSTPIIIPATGFYRQVRAEYQISPRSVAAAQTVSGEFKVTDGVSNIARPVSISLIDSEDTTFDTEVDHTCSMRVTLSAADPALIFAQSYFIVTLE